jgi:two-component system chemotaxis sensor kinase CheA
MTNEKFELVKNLGGKLAEELVFAEAETDTGLLPLNSLLCQIEEGLTGEELPEAFGAGVKAARAWVDEIFDTTGKFTKERIAGFGLWSEWFQEALSCLKNGVPAEPFSAGSTQVGVQAVTPINAEKNAPAAPENKEAAQSEPGLVLNLKDDGELIAEFINEAQEHLQNIEQGVLVLEDKPEDADTLNSIFRAFHTFKGGSGFLNLTAIQSLAHELESLLDQARQGKLSITPPVVNIILEGGDTLKQFTAEISAQISGAKPSGQIVVPTLSLLGRIREVLSGCSKGAGKATSPAPSNPQPAAPVSPPVSTATQAAPVIKPAPAKSEPEKPSSDVEKTDAAKHAAPAATVPADAGSTVIKAANAVVKVDTLKLDSLVDLVGEMVIAQSIVLQSQDLNALQSEQLNRDLAHLGRISRDLQRTAMSMRMVPINGTFQKMNRVVRDLAAKVGKHVQLQCEGEETELDRTIVEEINDPLVHMIRNSIDHGIEKPEIREQRGKLPMGTITLRAYYKGGSIVIEIQDDGNGLDRDRIMAKAIEKGIVRPDEHLTESQVFGLIMAAGFSTAEKVTDISGRGVGMDVVRRNIEKLRGKLEIRSVPGKGSTFSIFLPLTLAIIDGLLVSVGGQRYIIPTLSVCESFRPTEGMIRTVQGKGEMILVRGKYRPLLRLYEHLDIQGARTDATQCIVIVVEAGHDARCILVDQLLGKQEVVIKSLGETFRKNKFVSGAAILGDGRVGLILDPQALVYLESAPLEAAA